MTQDGAYGAGEEARALVGEYVLGLLSPAEHARLSGAIAADPALRAERDAWQSRFGALDEDFVEQAPPSRLWPALEKRLFGVSAARGGVWNSLGLWRALTGAAAAVAVVAVGFTLSQPAPVDPDQFAAQLVAAIQAEGSSVRFLAVYDQGSGSVRLVGLDGDPGPDRDFELWFIKGEAAPVSMGVIPAHTRAEIELPAELRAAFAEGAVLAISVEPPGGSPTGSPTGPVVATGAATLV